MDSGTTITPVSRPDDMITSVAQPDTAPGAPSARVRRRAVVNLRDARPAWEIPGWAREAIAAAFPKDWDIVFVETLVDASAGGGDGAGVSPEAIEAAAGTEVYLGFGAPREVLLAGTAREPRLRWMHTGTAGVASLLYPEMLQSDVVLTNSAGIHAPAMAETVLGMILHFARGLDHAVRAQAVRRWDPDPFSNRPGAIAEVDGATLGILGLGGTGLELARRARALGMNVIALRRSGRPAPVAIELVTGPGALPRLLASSDYVVLALPSTPATRGILDAPAIAAIKPGAVVINVARGDVLDEDALIRALASGALRGAGLDVFREEPLPSDSPLWQLPNVLITPHVSATTSRFWTRQVDLIRDNVGRYLSGRALRNVVDKKRGY